MSFQSFLKKTHFALLSFILLCSCSGKSNNNSSNSGSSSSTSSESTSSSEEEGEEMKFDYLTVEGNGFISSGSFNMEKNSAISLNKNSIFVFNDEFKESFFGVTVSNPRGQTSDNGIIFGLSYDNESFWEGTGISYYFFFVNIDGLAYLGKTVNNSWSELGTMQIKDFNRTNDYNLRVYYSNNLILCYINDFLYISYIPTTRLTGIKFGLRAGGNGICFNAPYLSNDKKHLFNLYDYGKDISYASDININEGWTALNYIDEDGENIDVAIYKPQNYDPNKKYPIELFLHGDGVTGRGMLETFMYPDATAMARQVAREHPEEMFILVPSSRKTWIEFYDMGVDPNYPSGHHEYGEIYVNSELLASVSLLKKCINYFSLDDQRVYLTGYSKGGHASEYLLATMPELFSAASIGACRGDPECTENYCDLPVFFFSGGTDNTVPASEVSIVFEKYTELGGQGRHKHYPNANHLTLEYAIQDDPEWLPFILSKTKENRCSHSFGENVVIRNASCLAFAKYEKTCSKCGHKHISYGQLGKHDFHDDVCNICGKSNQNKGFSHAVVDVISGWETKGEGDASYYENHTNRATRIFKDKCISGIGSIEFDFYTNGMAYDTNLNRDRVLWAPGLMLATALTDQPDIGTFMTFGKACYSSGIFASFQCINGLSTWSTFSNNKTTKLEDGVTHHVTLYFNIPGQQLIFVIGDTTTTISIPSEIASCEKLYVGLYASSVRYNEYEYGTIKLGNFSGDFVEEEIV